jgi:hypothetical protein
MAQAFPWENPEDPFNWYVKQTSSKLDEMVVVETIVRPSAFLPGFEDVIEFTVRERRALKKTK